jgi:hypothetical protein
VTIARAVVIPLAIVVAFSAATLPGCAAQHHQATSPEVDPMSSFPGLTPGHTTREQVLLTIGKPAATYENERIFIYRLSRRPDGHLVRVAADSVWVRADTDLYDFVVVFDGAGALKTTSLVHLGA